MSLLLLKKLIISREREINKEEIQSSNSRTFQPLSIPNTSGLQCQKKKKNQSIQTDDCNQEAAEISKSKCSECLENHVQNSKEDNSIERVRCRNWLHGFSSPFKEKCFDCSRKLPREKQYKIQKWV